MQNIVVSDSSFVNFHNLIISETNNGIHNILQQYQRIINNQGLFARTTRLEK